MKISTETLTVLKNFATINNSIYLDEAGYLKTKTPNSSNVIGVAKIDETLPEVAIYSLDEFLGAITLLEDDIKFKFTKDYINMAGEGMKIKYRLSDPSHILSQCKSVEDYNAFDNFSCNFNLNPKQLDSIQKAARVLNADVLSIELTDGKGNLSLINSELPLANSFDMDIKGTGTGTAKIFVENMKIIQGTYNVLVSDDTVIKFQNEDFPLFYFVACAILN